MSRAEEEKMIERIRAEYRPDELTIAEREALYATIESRISAKWRPSGLWIPAFAGAAATLVAAFLVLGDGPHDPPVEVSGESVLADELLLGSELLEEPLPVPLSEEFDAIAALFLDG